ncbi:hypothetical protein QQS21_008269 [Conoideocrella luteorostrata]|uniref:Uncharacterized protein n=1 Tax=Conoideocrella luteorostrata TaxID=1105319 RepID=A0AAJ0CLW9_9HYPO|nr:hypothetical protein QQS21_008269 [Conoideocrella luteorostrata]
MPLFDTPFVRDLVKAIILLFISGLFCLVKFLAGNPIAARRIKNFILCREQADSSRGPRREVDLENNPEPNEGNDSSHLPQPPEPTPTVPSTPTHAASRTISEAISSLTSFPAEADIAICRPPWCENGDVDVGSNSEDWTEEGLMQAGNRLLLT